MLNLKHLHSKFQPSQEKCKRNNSSNRIHVHSILVATLQASTPALKSFSHMLSLKKPHHYFPHQDKRSFQIRPSICFLLQTPSRHLTIPRHLHFLTDAQASRGINATQKRKLTMVSDTEPPLFPLYQVTRKLDVSLISFYKPNTALKPTSTVPNPILQTSPAEKPY